MKSFFEGIADFFVNVIFKYTMDPFRFAESWAIANILNWMFMLIGATAFIYWMLQLKKYNDSGEEDTSSTSHSYL